MHFSHKRDLIYPPESREVFVQQAADTSTS